jgi:hypothetical protein
MPLPGREIAVSSWQELIAELHSINMIPSRSDEGKHRRSPYVFRGVDVATWDLQTSFERLISKGAANPALIERALVRNFRKYASAGAFDQPSEWYVLAVAQHNGLPTRCLDWSWSPLVAAHFACGDEKYKDDDGAIWCIHAGILRDINVAAVLYGVAWVYDTRLLEKSFADLDALNATSAAGDLMLLWEPPSLDQRIAAQSGLLSIMNSEIASYAKFLQMHCKTYPDLLVRIVLKASMKSEARDMLDQNNINERSMFPGLPGLCSWLKRYYGVAW